MSELRARHPGDEVLSHQIAERARAIATKQDVEGDHKQIEFETIEDEGALELISTEEIERYEFE